jgi:hypothetical protein
MPTPVENQFTISERKETEAAPIIRALIQEAKDLRRKVEANIDFQGRREWLDGRPTLPPPVARLTQYLLQEADPAPEMLTDTLPLVAFFAQGCRSQDDWGALSQGPYGEELFKQAWLLYESMAWPQETWARNTCAVVAAFRHESAYGFGEEGQEELKRLINSQAREDIGRGLLTCAGLLWTSYGAHADIASVLPLHEVGSRVYSEDPAICEAAVWAWASIHRERKIRPPSSPETFDRLMRLWLGETDTKRTFPIAAYALCQNLGLPRDAWAPTLTEAQARCVRIAAYPSSDDPEVRSNSLGAALMVAFHARSIWADDQLGALLMKVRKGYGLNIRSRSEDYDRFTRMLAELDRKRLE